MNWGVTRAAATNPSSLPGEGGARAFLFLSSTENKRYSWILTGTNSLWAWPGHPIPSVHPGSSSTCVTWGKSPYFSGFHLPHLKSSIICYVLTHRKGVLGFGCSCGTRKDFYHI